MNTLLLPSLILTNTISNDSMPSVEEMSTGVVNISEAISKYGAAIVIMAVFFVIFMILIVIMLLNNTRMMNQIMNSKSDSDKQEQELISKLMDNILKSGKTDSNELAKALEQSLTPLTQKIDKLAQNNTEPSQEEGDDYHKDIVGAYIDINMAFKDISRQTLNELGCNRVAIYIFHNGNQSMHGLPFFKMSCIHEWTNHGSNTLRGKSHSDMPLHLFNDFIEDLYKSGYYKTDDISKAMIEDNSIEEFTALSANTKSLYLIGVKDMYGSLIGFIDAEFSEIETFETDSTRDEFVRSKLNDMMSKIAPIIGNKYIYKKG